MDAVHCVFVCVCVAALVCAGGCIALPQQTTLAQQKLEQRMVAALEAAGSRGPAINWKWDNWITGGPTCVDHRNLTLVDIPGGTESIRTVLETLQKAMDNTAAQVKDQLGLALGITYNGKVLFFGSAGSTEKGNMLRPTLDTVVSIGSITKIFTTLMMTALADQGVLQTTDPVTKFFNEKDEPAFSPVNPYDPKLGAAAVTLESLASHTSGLPRESPCLYGKECDKEAVRMVSAFPLFHQPLTRPHYSNIGYTILGRSCERAVQRHNNDQTTYEEWLVKKALLPFNMTSSGFDYPNDIVKRMAAGYVIMQDGSLQRVFPTSLFFNNPCGGMYSTTRDMLSFASRLMENSGTVLSPNAREQYLMPGVDMPDGVSSFGRAGWEVAYANGFRTLTKGGLVGGFGTSIALIPELRLGVFGWINALNGLVPSKLTAVTMNLLVPTLLAEIQKHQPKHEEPVVMDTIVGTYAWQGVKYLVVQRDAHTSATGIYTGVVYGAQVRFEYDAKTTAAFGQGSSVYVFRYRTIPAENMDSCLTLSSSGTDDGLVFFVVQGSSVSAYVPDLAIRNVPKQA